MIDLFATQSQKCHSFDADIDSMSFVFLQYIASEIKRRNKRRNGATNRFYN